MRCTVLGLCLALAVGCGGINETYKAEIDRRVAAMHSATASFPPMDAAEPLPLAVGQWAEFKLTGANKRPGFASYKVVGQQGSAFWVETALTTYTGKQEIRMLIDFGDRTNPDTFQVHDVQMRNNDKLVDMPAGTMGMMQALWKPVLSNFIIVWNDAPREDARAIAGHFEGCYKRRITTNVGLYHQSSDAWMHAAVPINGVVRSVTVGKNPSLTELVAFGTEGATSSFPARESGDGNLASTR